MNRAIWGAHPLPASDDLALLRQAWTQTLAHGAAFEVQHRIRHRSGTFRSMLNRAMPVRNEQGA